MYILEKICMMVRDDGVRRGKDQSDTGGYEFFVVDEKDDSH